jgi:predicted Zn-dependent protease with MMP-like domain
MTPGRRPMPSSGGGRDGAERRDRHGRGLRGPLVPSGLPLARSRAEQFDGLVLDAAERLDQRWSEQLAEVEFAVEDVPPSDPAPWEHGEVPLGRLFPRSGGHPARIVVYRRPVETRTSDLRDTARLVHDVVVEQVAHLIGMEPHEIDPRYGAPE